jgi:hypothetical protein
VRIARLCPPNPSDAREPGRRWRTQPTLIKSIQEYYWLWLGNAPHLWASRLFDELASYPSLTAAIRAHGDH